MTAKNSKLIAIALVAGLLTLLPPWLIGTGSSALTVQSLEHWMAGSPDSFEALHVHWLWIPRVIAFITGDAFSALIIFRVLVVGCAALLFALTARRLFDEKRAIIGTTMLVLNVVLLYFYHTFNSQLLTLIVACALLYLFTSPNPISHRFGALLFGLSLSIGFWPFILFIAVLTIALNLHHSVYTPKARATYVLFGLIAVGVASYLLLELFYFGGAHVWQAINPTFYPPRGVSRILEGIILAVFSINVLFVLLFRKKGNLSRDFQSAFVILGVFFIANTFSRDAMLEDVAIILPCLILVALDKYVNPVRIAIIYGIVNIGLFVSLPSFVSNPELALATQRRVSSKDDIAFSYYKALDLFSYTTVEKQNTVEIEARNLLSQEPLDSTLVILNPSTDTWLDAATLAAEFPNDKCGWYYGRPLNVVRLNGLRDTEFIKMPGTPYLAGLFDKEFAREFIDSSLPAGVPLRESQHLQYINCRGNEAARKALIDQLFFLQYEGFHSR